MASFNASALFFGHAANPPVILFPGVDLNWFSKWMLQLSKVVSLLLKYRGASRSSSKHNWLAPGVLLRNENRSNPVNYILHTYLCMEISIK